MILVIYFKHIIFFNKPNHFIGWLYFILSLGTVNKKPKALISSVTHYYLKLSKTLANNDCLYNQYTEINMFI